MQLVADPRRLGRAVSRARSSARRAFGSEDVYLERFIPDARHVEVQIVADSNGVCSHLWERECSVQRRHQKVIEEAPSPSISQNTRNELTSAATRAAQSVGFTNVGTFEFLVDQNDAIYFIEANTRLQVEHATTEMVTGVDIVERQLRIAAGQAGQPEPGASQRTRHPMPDIRRRSADLHTLTGHTGRISHPLSRLPTRGHRIPLRRRSVLLVRPAACEGHSMG